MKNKIDKSRHLACIHQENRQAVVYGCRDVAIVLRQPLFKESQCTNTFHNERKKVFEPMFVSKAKGKKKSNHEVKGFWQRSFRLNDGINLMT